MFNITEDMLRKITGEKGNNNVIAELIKELPEVMHKHHINTDLRVSHFLGQLASDTNKFNTGNKDDLLLAGEYWSKNNLNDYADKDNGKQITRKINRGYDSLKEKLRFTENAKEVLSKVNSIDPPVKLNTVVETVKPVEVTPTPPITVNKPVSDNVVTEPESTLTYSNKTDLLI